MDPKKLEAALPPLADDPELEALLNKFFPPCDTGPDGYPDFATEDEQRLNALFERFGLRLRVERNTLCDAYQFCSIYMGNLVNGAMRRPDEFEYITRDWPDDWQSYARAIVSSLCGLWYLPAGSRLASAATRRLSPAAIAWLGGWTRATGCWSWRTRTIVTHASDVTRRSVDATCLQRATAVAEWTQWRGEGAVRCERHQLRRECFRFIEVATSSGSGRPTAAGLTRATATTASKVQRPYVPSSRPVSHRPSRTTADRWDMRVTNVISTSAFEKREGPLLTPRQAVAVLQSGRSNRHTCHAGSVGQGGSCRPARRLVHFRPLPCMPGIDNGSVHSDGVRQRMASAPAIARDIRTCKIVIRM
ncbi:MAG: hypothetical protein QOF74_1228 [Caballeronia mineralivorans]|nr:hypothetical protein [Caballeronia mineralivorans]